MSRNKLLIIAAGFVGLAVLALIGVLLSSNSADEQPSTQADSKANDSSVEPTQVEPPPFEIVEDDGLSLWMSPTEGEPISLAYLPAGTQVVLHLRPAELLGHPEGERVLAALGPWGAAAIEQLQAATGVDLSEVAALTVAVHPTMQGDLHSTWRLELIEPYSPPGELPESTDGRTCFLPEEQNPRLLVCCAADDLAELEEQGGEPPLFPRDMQRLLERTDCLRSATLVMPTRFLQTEGHKLFGGGAEQLKEVLDAIVREKATAIALSAHWQEDFFLELQSSVKLDLPAHRFAAQVRKWIPSSSSSLQTVLAASPPHPHGAQVIERFPAMLQLLGTYARSSEEDGVGVLRCYLPSIAGHNLLAASELVLSLSEQSAETIAANTVPQSLTEKLTQVTSLAFPKDTLERALEILAEELNVEIRIAGGDLQLEGITKNQSFAINLRDKPAAEILQAIMSQANPDRTAERLSDPKQKLLYVLQNPDSPNGVVVVTTRAAAAKRGESLPKVFVQQSD